ncbi:MAG: cupin domain-containing protein [Elusimicrobia bacterium]|nr:cupin domain-containing protein [Elusimicrobiota bacterium]
MRGGPVEKRTVLRQPIRIVKKPWGREIWFAFTKKYLGKILEIRKGHRLSLQYHKKKHETLYVLSGSCQVQIQHHKYRLGPGKGWVLPPKTLHRFRALSGKVRLLEVSTSHPKDVVRLADDYRRLG